MRIIAVLLLVAAILASCNRVFDVSVYNNKNREPRFQCLVRNGMFMMDERLAICDTAKECMDVCDAAREKFRDKK